jgi:hypothetical protein
MIARVLAAAVIGGIVFFVLGGLIFGAVLDPMVMKPNTNPEAVRLMNDPPHWIPLILGNLVFAFFLAYVFEKWAGIRTFGGGFVAGAILMFLVDLYFQLMFTAFMNVNTSLTPVLADLVGSTLIAAVTGGVIGLVLGKMNKTAAAA